MLFHLALTYGLERDPVAALERTIGLVEATAVRHGIEGAVQASIGVADGERLWAFRYATEGQPRTLFVSAGADAVRQLYPDDARLQRPALRARRRQRRPGATRTVVRVPAGLARHVPAAAW